MAILKAENLSLKNGSKYILKDLNWEVKSGENWVLFGLNGCGKTTLLSILAGYKSGNFGETYLFDQLVMMKILLRYAKMLDLSAVLFLTGICKKKLF